MEKQKGVDLNFLPKNEQSYEIANKKIVDSKNFTIAAHGNSNYIYEYPNTSKENNIRGNGNIDYNVEKGRMKVFRGSCNGK